MGIARGVYNRVSKTGISDVDHVTNAVIDPGTDFCLTRITASRMLQLNSSSNWLGSVGLGGKERSLPMIIDRRSRVSPGCRCAGSRGYMTNDPGAAAKIEPGAHKRIWAPGIPGHQCGASTVNHPGVDFSDMQIRTSQNQYYNPLSGRAGGGKRGNDNGSLLN